MSRSSRRQDRERRLASLEFEFGRSDDPPPQLINVVVASRQQLEILNYALAEKKLMPPGGNIALKAVEAPDRLAAGMGPSITGSQLIAALYSPDRSNTARAKPIRKPRKK
jgi:hypothetical protein